MTCYAIFDMMAYFFAFQAHPINCLFCRDDEEKVRFTNDYGTTKRQGMDLNEKFRALRLLGYVTGDMYVVTTLEVKSLQLWIVETLSNPMSEYFRDLSDLVFEQYPSDFDQMMLCYANPSVSQFEILQIYKNIYFLFSH